MSGPYDLLSKITCYEGELLDTIGLVITTAPITPMMPYGSI